MSSESLTVAFGDAAADVYGVCRFGHADGAASALAILFAGGTPVAVALEGGIEQDAPASWDDVAVAGLAIAATEPDRAWRLTFSGDGAELDLSLEAAGAIADIGEDAALARLGGMAGFEQPVRVQGTLRAGGAEHRIDGPGQRGRSWGEPNWDRVAEVRTVAAWFDGDRAVTYEALRPAKGSDHEADVVAAALIGVAEGNGTGPVATEVFDARLSTTYDGEGRQRAAGLELWVTEDGWPHRAAGEVVCGTSIDLGRLTLDCAFLRWRMDGAEGVGRYDILRRVQSGG